MLLQRLATGATGVKQARYRRRPTRGSEALVRACAVYTQLLNSAEDFSAFIYLCTTCAKRHPFLRARTVCRMHRDNKVQWPGIIFVEL